MTRFAEGSLLLCVLLAPAAASAAPPPFTGDVPTDYTDPGTVIIVDPGGIDVGVPLQFPSGTISGNDIEDVRLVYVPGTDTLYVGINTYGIAGDVDGDGDPSNTSTTLGDLGGSDIPDFGATESFSVVFDINEDGCFDVIAGVSAFNTVANYTVSEFTGTYFAPGFAFGAPLPAHTGSLFGSPSASAPDLEFTIEAFSALPVSTLPGCQTTDDALSFGLNSFVGSVSDAGIGEDFNPGADATVQVCFDMDGDGVTSCDGDCDDEDPTVYPGADEVCDGVDNNCDGEADAGGDNGVSGVVFLDIDKDGAQDAGEPGIAGATVTASGPDCDGNGSADSASTTTDADGGYAFEGLCAGDWTVAYGATHADTLTTPNPVVVGLDCGEDAEVDFGTFRLYTTRTIGYWKNHGCSVAPFLPLQMGSLTFTTTTQVSNYLGQSPKGDKRIILGKQLLGALLNAAAFGSDAYPWTDGDTIAALITDAEAAFANPSASGDTLTGFSSQLDSYNNSGDSGAFPPGVPTCSADGGKKKPVAAGSSSASLFGQQLQDTAGAQILCAVAPRSEPAALAGFLLLLGLALPLRRR